MQKELRERKKLMTIGEASEYLGVSVDTLRRWEAKGRITPYRSPGGHRHYESNDLDKLFDKRYTRDEPTIRSKSDVKKDEEPKKEADQNNVTNYFPKITLPAWRAIKEEQPVEKNVTDVNEDAQRVDVLERPVREIRIPENAKIRISPQDISISPSDAYIRQQNSSILTPPLQNRVTDNGPATDTSFSTKTKLPKLTENKAFLIYMSVMVSVVLFVIAWYFLWKNSQTVLSPIP